ncbi:MAG: ATP-binding protein [Gammaproteobacteria bacterium]|nr:ATP-binding protein [Gammaproteobacteria bacterium]
MIDWNHTYAAVWRPRKSHLRPVHHIDPIALDDLVGVDLQKQRLLDNTRRFLAAKPANNALLWGARGTGKSSLIKAVCNACKDQGLRIIEVDKTDLLSLHDIVDDIRELPQRFILYCDDLSFENNETAYKPLKSVLEGSIELPPRNVLLYATSNRRNLVPETMQDNLASAHIHGEVHYADAIEEKISLADRFGLRLSFYSINQQDYLAIVDSYFKDYRGDRGVLRKEALRFAAERGARSGRVAKQFFCFYSARD